MSPSFRNSAFHSAVARAFTTAAICLFSGEGLADSAAAQPEGPLADSARVAEIQALVAKAHGGQAALRAFRGLHARGEIVAISDGLAGRLEFCLLFDESMRAEIHYAPRSEIRILAGALAWSGGRQKQLPVSRDMKDSMRLQYHRLIAPFEIAAAAPGEFSLAEPEGDAPDEADPHLVRLKRRWGPRLEMTYWIDAQTGLLRRTIGRGGEGEGAFVITSDFGEYRDVEGPDGVAHLPHRATTRIGDRIVSETVLDRLEEKADFPSSTFLPAEAAGDF